MCPVSVTASRLNASTSPIVPTSSCCISWRNVPFPSHVNFQLCKSTSRAFGCRAAALTATDCRAFFSSLAASNESATDSASSTSRPGPGSGTGPRKSVIGTASLSKRTSRSASAAVMLVPSSLALNELATASSATLGSRNTSAPWEVTMPVVGSRSVRSSTDTRQAR